MSGQKISQYGADQSPVTTDYVLGNKASGPSTVTFKLSDLITLIGNNLLSNLYNPYKFSVYQSNSQAISSGATVKITYDTKEFDTSSNFDVATNHRFVAPIAGFYFISLTVDLSSAGFGTSATMTAFIYKNGSELKRGFMASGSGNTYLQPIITVTSLVQLAAGDYIEGYGYNGDTSSRSTGTGKNQTYMSGFLVSAI